MKRIAVLFCLFFMLLTASCSSQCGISPLEIRVLDVGQGDAVLIRSSEGNILIDAGTEASQETLCLRLRELDVTALRLAVFTHADEDHIGGADGVLSDFLTEELWFNGQASDNEAAARLLSVAEARGTVVRSVQAGQVFSLGEISLAVLAPIASIKGDTNQTGIVLKLHFREIDAMFTGDVDKEVELALLEIYGATQLDCDFYKVGHHGSYTSSSKRFLEAMTPRYAVISCGAGNPYGHPHGDVLAALDAVDAHVLRTDLFGELVFECDGYELEWIKD